MPTPESEAFLRKKPTVPPSYEGVDMGDFEAVANVRDAIIREQWVQVMMARLVREEMGKCYHREGVNHLEKCGKYRERYLQLLKTAKVHGYKGYEQNYLQSTTDKNYIETDYPTVTQAKGAKGSDFRLGNTIGAKGERF
ncbi:hypothetical protein LTS08_004373 [Lithohypha guttulata]|uniref:Uncharacterized protein n=1 Tax=Lithohypha guttulata TaxID=1690604 RepID=A0AAN7SZP8_9EURO|nr:hypothetical protein LTR51_007664 [Lithohypha guttulata]KAK5086317.1 hypothetical protein LTR05_003485 [Lithohypha guttulata]KAK5101914.1 hypothetical protein LTS08_004373 [Lithohypha guttulata]